MKNATIYEILPKTHSPIMIKKFVNHNSGRCLHFHDEMEILYFTHGNGRVVCNMREYEVTAGDIIFVNGNELHSGDFCEKGSTYYCIHIRTDFFHNLIGKEYVSFENLIRNSFARSLLDKVILNEANRGFKSLIETRKTLYEFFSCISEKFAHSVLSEAEYKKKFKKLDTFNLVIRYIGEHYYENISIDFLASKFYVSASYFSHIFKNFAQKSLVEYLNEVRISHAKVLLERENMSIGEISAKVGYSDINYFSRRFKKEVGITATEYRKRLVKQM